jgi:hypothetical protein
MRSAKMRGRSVDTGALLISGSIAGAFGAGGKGESINAYTEKCLHRMITPISGSARITAQRGRKEILEPAAITGRRRMLPPAMLLPTLIQMLRVTASMRQTPNSPRQIRDSRRYCGRNLWQSKRLRRIAALPE